MNPRVFREYDIRGNADRDLDDGFANELGKAIGTHLKRAGAQKMTLGRDCRVTSPRLHKALRSGILSTGMHIIDVGVVATPLLYFSVFHFDADGGVQITGSHNPPEDNGFKILRGKSTIHGAEIQALRELIEKRDFETGLGVVTERDIQDAYIDVAASKIKLGPRRFKVVVDAKGRIVWGDQLMIFFARAILKEVPGATFVSEVKCSKAMYDEIAKAGGKAIMWKVGHSLIKEKMKEEKAVLAGEMSGHIFFAHRYFGYDDAIYSAARLCELLTKEEKPLADHVDALHKLFNTPEIRYELPDEIKFDVVRRVVEHFKSTAEKEGHTVVDVDGARVTWKDGWALVRASNTQAALVLRFEAETEPRLGEIRKKVEAALKK